MTYPYRFDKESIEKILKSFRKRGRSYLTALPSPVAKKATMSRQRNTVSYQHDELPGLFSYCLYYWQRGEEVTMTFPPEESSLSMSFIKKILSLKNYYLILSVCPHSKIYPKLQAIGDIEVFTPFESTPPSSIVTQEKSEEFLLSLVSPYFSFEKKRLDHKQFIDDLKKNLDKVVPALYAQSHQASLSGQKDLLKYIENLQKHTQSPQSSYLQGMLMKWITYDFLNTNELSH